MDTAGSAHPTAQEIAALRRLARLTGIGAWDYDVAGERLFWTEETYRLHELEPARFTPTIAAAIGFFAPEAQPLIMQALREGIEHGRRFDLELPLVTARGRRLWVRAIGEAELANGRCVRLAGTLQDVSAARQARDALRARTDQAQKLALVAEHTSDLVIVTDAQHRIEWVNASFERVTGYAAAEVLGKTPRALLNRADTLDSPRCQQWRRDVSVGNGVSGAELKLYRKDGTPYWVELEQRPVRDETGAVSHFIHIQRDITARREARERESELARRLRLITATTGIGTFQRDLASGAGSWDEATFRLFGFAPAPQPPPLADVLARIHAEDRARYCDYLDALGRDGPAQEVEFRVVHDDGRIGYLHERGSLEPGAGGRLAVGVVLDITGQRNAERQALAAAEQLALAVEATGIGFYWCSADNARLQLDPQARTLLGLSPQDKWLSRWQFESMVIVEDRAIAARVDARRVLAAGAVEVSFRIVRRDGERRWLRVRCAPAPAIGTGEPRVIGMMADVTEQKFEEAQRERLALAAAAAGIGTWEVELAGGAGRWSDEMRALHGLGPNEPVPTYDAWRERFVYPHDRAAIGDLRQMRETREALEREFRIVRPDGTVHWIHARLVCLPADAHGPARLVGAAIDITARKLAEQRVDELAALLRLADQSDALGVGYALRDLETGAGQWTAQTRRLLGYGTDDAVPEVEQWLQRVAPADREKLRALYRTPPPSGSAQEVEFVLVPPAGGVRHILLRAGALYGADGRPTRLLCALIDVTALKRTALELNAALRRLELATAGSAVGIWERELDREHAYWSPEAFALWGLPVRDRAPSWAELVALVHPEDRSMFEQRWHVLAQSPTFVDTEFRVLRPDGAEAWLLTRGRFEAAGSDRPARVIGVVLDISARKRAERRANEVAGWLELATSSIGIGLWYRDAGDALPSWDAQMFRIFGLDPAAGAPSDDAWQAMILPEDRAQFLGVDIHAPPPGSTLSFSYRIRRPDGEVRHLQSRRACLYGADGRALRVYGAVIDVTDTRTATEALSEARDRLSLAAQVGGIASWERNLETGEGRWDPLLFRFYGLEPVPDVPSFARVLEMVHPEDREKFRRNWERVLESNGTVEMETRVVHPDGKVLVLVTRARADRRADGTPWRIVGATIDATELRRTARELRDALQRLQVVGEASGIGTWVRELDSDIAFWDATMFRLYGLPADAPVPSRERAVELVHPDDRETVRAAWEKIQATDGPLEFEFRVVLPDGSLRHLSARGRLERYPDGRPWRILGATIDITDMRTAQRERDALAERMHFIAESVGIGVWDWDPVARVTVWNDRMYELFGHTREWFADKHWLDVIHPADRTAAEAALTAALAGGDRFESEFRVVWADGSVHWIASRGRMRRDATGRVARAIGVNIDISDRRRAEQAARDLLERMRLTTAAAGIGLWELDLATQEMQWDEQTYRLAGRTPADLGDLRTSWISVIHPDDVPMMRAAQKRVLKELQPFDLETRIVWPCGEVRYVVLRGQLQFDERGRPVKQFGVVFDITERKLAESALRAKETAERANQAKTEFLSRISHELRTPLNAILGFTQILELDQQQPLAHAQRERVRHIQHAGWHLLALIDEILDLSRIESGKANLALAAVPLADVIDECLTLVAPDAARRGIEIAVQRQADAPTAAWADRTRVKQVLLNLLSNAVKYNRERGSVRIALGADAGGNALIAVRDTGHGLSARQIDQLFQPFNRLGLESAPIQGTGIGLALSLKLIEQMGGKLEVSSELQVGTEFRVTLPAARAKPQAAPQPDTDTPVAAPRSDVRGGVLYVEDNSENVAIVEQMLTLRPQVKLFTAGDGATARVLAAVCQPDLILLDMRLPDTDGLALFRALRAQPETKHIPCVALSANALPEDAARARAAGFADYWTKPLDAAKFLRGIDALLARP